MSEWNKPKAIAVESCGFWAAAPTWKRKGTWILLTSEQLGYVTTYFPEAFRWRVDGHDLHARVVSGYPLHKFLGYSDAGPCNMVRDAMPVTSSRGDMVVDAVALLKLMMETETYVSCHVVNGTRMVVALLQAATGVPTTGRAIPVHACEACDGRGSTGDYARGTGKQCETCNGSGELRDAPPTSVSERALAAEKGA